MALSIFYTPSAVAPATSSHPHQACRSVTVDLRRLLVRPMAAIGPGRGCSAPDAHRPHLGIVLLLLLNPALPPENRIGLHGMGSSIAGLIAWLKSVWQPTWVKVVARDRFGGGRTGWIRHVVLPVAGATRLRGSHARGALQARPHRLEHGEPPALLHLAGAAHHVSGEDAASRRLGIFRIHLRAWPGNPHWILTAQDWLSGSRGELLALPHGHVSHLTQPTRPRSSWGRLPTPSTSKRSSTFYTPAPAIRALPRPMC